MFSSLGLVYFFNGYGDNGRQRPVCLNQSTRKGSKRYFDAIPESNCILLQVFYISEREFWEEIKDEYVQRIADMSPDEVYPSNNPGPTKPDGSVNFECHCVGHLVASPCGHEFREAITCQKSSTDEEMEAGACGDQLLAFMECAMRTQCFKS
ncbi:unnamed protein product [Nippostrongylus brasiliensis]|uniref:CHCH domain-containing protein n=1 Tax=Nippostrongylus brasiliensis TaxID=27835 RepID=A0A3P7CDI3_NIPBR|nr:unnamed protein product [Nippostrongylus brasiliensis]